MGTTSPIFGPAPYRAVRRSMRRRTAPYGARRRDFRPRSRDFTQFHGALNKIREIHLVCKKFYIEVINHTSFDPPVRLLAQIRNLAFLDDSRFKDAGN